jgi:integrase
LLIMKDQGYPEESIRVVGRRLRMIDRAVDLNNPVAVKRYIHTKKSDNYKIGLERVYGYYASANKIVWERSKYRRDKGIPRPPTTENLTKVIASAGRKYAVVFTLLAETGAMPAELAEITQENFNPQNGTVIIPGKKGHKSRIISLKSHVFAMAMAYLKEHGRFPSSNAMRKVWISTRLRASRKFQDPNLRKIRLYDLRHYFGTMLYYRTRDPLFTMEQMGHRKLDTTLIYAKLISPSFSDEFVVKAAKNADEACKLVEIGFEFVHEFQGTMIFRKRK